MAFRRKFKKTFRKGRRRSFGKKRRGGKTTRPMRIGYRM
ncbi:hypothetical protein [robinz microvirus RP_172]|nr:hypothetical protein [robinz microvirus RP_172]